MSLCDDYLYRHEQEQVPELVRSMTLTEGYEQFLRPDGTVEEIHWNPMEVMRDAFKGVRESFEMPSALFKSLQQQGENHEKP
jgi:hypothetical protein